MIFPDEKMIDEMATLIDEDGQTYIDSSIVRGMELAISHIKSAASECLEEMLEDRKKHYPDFSLSIREKSLAESLWQAAVISTAAKYEEKLREKDFEIERLLNSRNGLYEEAEYLQAENEQLKAAARDMAKSLEVCADAWTEKPNYIARVTLEEHKALMTKINKGG